MMIDLETLRISKTIIKGPSLLLDESARRCGLDKVLKKIHGQEVSRELLALAYYSVCNRKPLSHAIEWLPAHGYEYHLTAPRISELLPTLNKDVLIAFSSQWMKIHGENMQTLFDLTAIGCYHKREDGFTEWGHAKGHESHLRQVNIAMLCSRKNRMPLWFSKNPGSMSDTIVFQDVVTELNAIGAKNCLFIMDKGMWSKENRGFLHAEHHRFLVPVPDTVGWKTELFTRLKKGIRSPLNIIDTEDGSLVYGVTDYQMAKYGRMWIHLYFDGGRKEYETNHFMRQLKECYDELLSGNLITRHKNLYDKYFTVKETPKRGRKVTLDNEKIDRSIERFGFWMIGTNGEKDRAKAHEIYHKRNDIEILFSDLTNELDCKRLRVHEPASMQGRLYLHFISLILLTEFKKIVQESENKTKLGALTMLPRMESYTKSSIESDGKKRTVHTTATKTQREIFKVFTIESPDIKEKNKRRKRSKKALNSNYTEFVKGNKE